MALRTLISGHKLLSTFIKLPAESSVLKSVFLDQLRTAKTASTSTLVLTDSCVKRLNEICDKQTYLRITVEGGGCSGFLYKFDLSNGPIQAAEDHVLEREGARVIVDKTSLQFIDGASVDYHVELIRSGFRIIANLKADQECSCGASFAMKLDKELDK